MESQKITTFTWADIFIHLKLNVLHGNDIRRGRKYQIQNMENDFNKFLPFAYISSLDGY